MPPTPDETAAAQLYDEIANTAPKALQRGVKQVEKLSPEDAEALDRGAQHWMRTTSRQVKIAFMWTGFTFAVLIAMGAVAALGALMWSFASEAVAAKKAGPIIGAILQFLAGVAVTLAVERFAKRKD